MITSGACKNFRDTGRNNSYKSNRRKDNFIQNLDKIDSFKDYSLQFIEKYIFY